MPPARGACSSLRRQKSALANVQGCLYDRRLSARHHTSSPRRAPRADAHKPAIVARRPRPAARGAPLLARPPHCAPRRLQLQTFEPKWPRKLPPVRTRRGRTRWRSRWCGWARGARWRGTRLFRANGAPPRAARCATPGGCRCARAAAAPAPAPQRCSRRGARRWAPLRPPGAFGGGAQSVRATSIPRVRACAWRLRLPLGAPQRCQNGRLHVVPRRGGRC